MDPYDILDAVDIAGQIPGSFGAQMESKKWNERKEALETIDKITSVPKIQNSDFSDLVRILKKTIAKDTNIVVVTLAAKCLCQLAKGLRQNFSPYADSCMSILIEKFKEKKPNVVSVIRDAVDATFVGTNIESIYEDIIQFLDNKNPQIKAETALFLSRAFARYPAQVTNKRTLRPLINALIKTLSDMDATVRDNSAMAIGTAMKVTGEKLMMTLIGDVEPIKITKIKECCEKAEIFVAPVNGQANVVVSQVNGQQTEQTQPSDAVADEAEDDEERMYEMLDAVDIVGQIPSSFSAQMELKKWNERKDALETIDKVTSVPKIQNGDFSELVRVLKKTIAKDSNIVVVTLATKCLYQLANGLRQNFSPYADSCLSILFEKFKEKKPNVISVVRDAADAAFVGTNIESIHEEVIQFLDNKNPQIKAEMALFLSRTFAKYPAQVLNKKTLRPLVNALIKTLSDMDATVRDNSAMAIGTAMKVTGEKLMMTLIADVEPIKIPKIKEFCEKAQVKKIPQSVINAMNAPTAAAPPPPTNNHQPGSTNRNSATMVRSTSNRRLTTGGINRGAASGQKPTPSSLAAPSSNATVKRNATIIKRSTAPKRSLLPPSSASQHHQSNHHTPQTTNMGPPAPVAQPPQQQQLSQSNISLHQPLANSTPAKPVYPTTIRPHKTLLAPKHGNLDMTLFKLIADDQNEVIDSLLELQTNLSDDTEHEFKDRINQLIDLSCLQLIKSFEGLRTSPGDDLHLEKIKKLSTLLKQVFARKQLVSAASQQSIKFLLVQLFTLAQSCGTITTDQENDESVGRDLNYLVLAIMDSFEPTNIMCILTGLLNEPTSVSIVEPVKDAIIRSMRSFK